MAKFLGRKQNLRGFRSNRFGVDSYLYGNFEARLKLFKINSFVLPGEFGITGFYDIGRVWFDQDENTPSFNTWHEGVGGGIYFFTYDMVLLSAGIAQSSENSFFEFKLGYFF